MKITLKEVQTAYMKLKRNMYYEKLHLIARDNFINFEANFNNNPDKLEKMFQELVDFLNGLAHNGRNEIESELKNYLSKISLSIYSKKIERDNQNSDSNYINDEIETNKFTLTKENIHCNIPIPLQIMGVLWIQRIGKGLDDDLNKHCFGYRLVNQSNEKPQFKGKLFKQYHHQYAKWWQKGLDIAKRILREDGEDVILINYDVKTFYHSVCLDRDLLKKAINFEELEKEDQLLHTIMERVLINYNARLKKFKLNRNETGLCLPIGYHPAHIIANWYLDRFDKDVTQDLRPSYYGRYVDDIFMVFKSTIPKTKSKTISDKINIQNTFKYDREFPLKFQEAEYRFLKYMKQYFEPDFKATQINCDDCETYYRIDHLNFKTVKGLQLQSEKLFIYELKVGSPMNLIENFLREQKEKSSEFRFEAEDSDSISTDFGDLLFEQCFNIEDASRAKIKNRTQDKFALSVFLSRLIRRSALRKNPQFKGQLKKIVAYYRGANCIENWWVWEKIILALVINNQRRLFRKFITEAVDSIKNLKRSEKDTRLNRKQIHSQIERTHRKLLIICIKNAVAGNPEFIDDRLDKYLKAIKIYGSSEKVRKTAFIRQEYFAFPLIGLLKDNLNKKTPYSSLEGISDELQKGSFEIHPYFVCYSPIPVKFWQVAYLQWYKKLVQLNTTNGSSIKRTYVNEDLDAKQILDDAFDIYYDINFFPTSLKDEFKKDFFFQCETKEINELKMEGIDPIRYGLYKNEIRVMSKKKKDLQFGLVNEYVNREHYMNSAEGFPEEMKRLEVSFKILDEAQRKNCDLVVQPELSVPHSFIPSYCHYSDRHQLGIVSGIEHMRVKNVVFNFILTVLPIEIEGIYKDAIPVIRLKNHYAPKEENMINEMRATVPKPLNYEYHLFHWRGLYFTNYYCYELADINHRTLFQGEIDLLIAPVWNPDTNYYNGIIETSAREIHCVFSQVNTSQYGDTRWTLPRRTELKNPLIMKGGTTEKNTYTMALAEFNPKRLRKFQNIEYDGQIKDGSYKPTPPDYPRYKVKTRLKDDNFIIPNEEESDA
ncbi:MAG: RNA-directed DNA polymerase [Vicingaceae bacterium]